MTNLQRQIANLAPARAIYRRCFGQVVELNAAGISARFHAYSKEGVQALRSMGGELPTLEILLDTLQDYDCFWDVGAANGLYAIFAAKKLAASGKVVAFEPDPFAFIRLAENAHLNRLRNLLRLQAALSDREGRAVLQLGEVSGASRIVEHGRGKKIVTYCGDQLRDLGYPVPTAVKIDVEGHEMSVVRGMIEILSDPRCRIVYCEVHPPNEIQTLSRLLGDLDFRRQERRQRSWRRILT